MNRIASRCREIVGVVKRGYGVASGIAGDTRFPRGTLQLQIPHFKTLGLDLSDCHPGTINLDISPLTYTVGVPDYRFAQMRWSSDVPAETFSFCTCRVYHWGTAVPGWIYYPDPETKPEHFHDASTLEILAPWLEGVGVGDALTIEVDAGKVVVG